MVSSAFGICNVSYDTQDAKNAMQAIASSDPDNMVFDSEKIKSQYTELQKKAIDSLEIKKLKYIVFLYNEKIRINIQKHKFIQFDDTSKQDFIDDYS